MGSSYAYAFTCLAHTVRSDTHPSDTVYVHKFKTDGHWNLPCSWMFCSWLALHRKRKCWGLQFFKGYTNLLLWTFGARSLRFAIAISVAISERLYTWILHAGALRSMSYIWPNFLTNLVLYTRIRTLPCTYTHIHSPLHAILC